MKTLNEAITKMENRGGAGQSLRKHLTAVGINEWEDITRTSLYELTDHLRASVAPGSAKTILGNLKALLHRYEEELDLPRAWAKILQMKATPPMKTYLTESDLEKFEGARVHTRRQTFVKNVFLVCAYTGLRVSDAMNLTPENVVDGNLHYVAQKTKKAGAIPLKPGLSERIEWISENQDVRVTMVSYNRAVRQMARDAGIDEEVVVFKAGKEMKGPKWMFISSHTARISTASCLNRLGVPLGDISKLLQHSGTAMTERYVVRDRVELSEKAMGFFS